MASAIGIDWRSRLRRAVPQIVAGFVIGTATLVLAVRGVDWPAVGNALLHARPGMVALALASVVLAVMLSVVRWRLLFAPGQADLRWRSLAGAILIGQTLNIVIPARVGELARIYLVGSREAVSKSRVTATIVVEKVADLAIFAVSIGLLLIGMTMPEWMSRSGVALIGTAAVLVIATVALTFWSEALLRIIERLASHLPLRIREAIVRIAAAALGALHSLRDWRLGLAIWMLSAAIFFVSIATNYLVLAAMGLALPPVAALFLTIVLRIGVAPPSLPGRLGLFQYLIVLALAMFGVNRTAALSFSFALYAVAVVPILIAGSISLFAFRWKVDSTAAANVSGVEGA
jgi:uncharacterized protein (TIRG00374 family)